MVSVGERSPDDPAVGCCRGSVVTSNVEGEGLSVPGVQISTSVL